MHSSGHIGKFKLSPASSPTESVETNWQQRAKRRKAYKLINVNKWGTMQNMKFKEGLNV
jgi:hypothetical protein